MGNVTSPSRGSTLEWLDPMKITINPSSLLPPQIVSSFYIPKTRGFARRCPHFSWLVGFKLYSKHPLERFIHFGVHPVDCAGTTCYDDNHHKGDVFFRW